MLTTATAASLAAQSAEKARAVQQRLEAATEDLSDLQLATVYVGLDSIRSQLAGLLRGLEAEAAAKAKAGES